MKLLTVEQDISELAKNRNFNWLEPSLLIDYMSDCRWFSSKAKIVSGAEFLDLAPLHLGEDDFLFIFFLRLTYSDQSEESYCLPLEIRKTPHFPPSDEIQGLVAVFSASQTEEHWLLLDGLTQAEASRKLLQFMARGTSVTGQKGRIEGSQSFPAPLALESAPVTPITAEQSNSSIRIGDQLILKLYRRFQSGINPDIELGAFLTKKGFPNIAAVRGYLTYTNQDRVRYSLGILQDYISNQGDAWYFTLDSLSQFMTKVIQIDPVPFTAGNLLSRRITDAERKIFAPYLESAELLGVRTAELHLSLCGEASDPIFQPEPLEACDQKVLVGTISTQADLSLQLFLKRIGYLEKEVLHFKNRLIDSERLLQNRIHNYSKVFSKSKKIRCHGDLHLGQILVSGQDFVIIDFEGEPKKPIEERRRKQSPLRDVAGMIRSLNYALFTAFRIRSRDSGAGECKALENMAKAWNFWISSSYLQAYLSTARKGTFLPSDEQELSTLLEMFLLERAFYELEYELNNRPEWVPIPIQGILELTGV